MALGNTLNPMLKGDASDTAGYRPSWSPDTIAALWGLFTDDDLYNPDTASLKTVKRTRDSLALVLTNHLQLSPTACAGASATGTETAGKTHIHVRWVWIVQTVVVLALCLVFFVATVAKTWRDDLSKPSPLGYVFSQLQRGSNNVTAHEMLQEGKQYPDGRGQLDDCIKVAFTAEVKERN